MTPPKLDKYDFQYIKRILDDLKILKEIYGSWRSLEREIQIPRKTIARWYKNGRMSKAYIYAMLERLKKREYRFQISDYNNRHPQPEPERHEEDPMFKMP